MPCVTCHVSHATCHMPRVTCHVSHATCHMPRVTCHVSHATCHMPRVTCHVSHATCHMPRVTCYVSHAMCHMPLVTCQVSHVRCQCRTTLCSLHRLALSDVPNRMGQTTAKRTTRQRRWQSLRPQRLFARMGCADEQAMHSCVNCDGCMYGRCMRVCSSNMENAYDVTCEPFSPTLHLFSWKSDQKPIPLFSVWFTQSITLPHTKCQPYRPLPSRVVSTYRYRRFG